MHANQFWWMYLLRFQRYCYLQKRPNFPFRPWTIVHGHQIIQSIGIGLKKFIQVRNNVKCMHTNFGGCGLSGFGDIATFKNCQISLSNHGLSKNSIDRNQLKKIMQLYLDVKCMQTNFGGCTFSGFRDIATFKTAKFPFLTMDYSPWSSNNSIDRNWLKKFMQVGIDVKCMHTNFGGYGHSGFGDIATFKNGQISLSDHGL